MSSVRQEGRIRRTYKGRQAATPKKPSRRGKPRKAQRAWSDSAAAPAKRVPVPAYSHLSEVPQELLLRAAKEKYVWIQRFVREGCPRGCLLPYAREYAEVMNLPADQVPPYSTLNDWVHRYRAHGMLGLVDRVRKDSGTHRLLNEEQLEQMDTALLGGKACITAAHAFLVNHRPAGAPKPTYDAVRRAAQRRMQQNPHLYAIARHGLLWWRQHCRLGGSHEVVPGGYRLSVDSTVVDVWVQVANLSKPDGVEAKRVALTVVEDIGSRLIVAFNLSPIAVDSGILCGTLHRAVDQEVNREVHPGLVSTGVPHEIVLDQGAEHRGRFRELLAKLGVQVVESRPNAPESHAHVERAIGTLTRELFAQLPGYSATQNVDDPYAPLETDGKRRATTLKYEPYRLAIPVQGLMTLAELEQHILGWAVVYNNRPHGGLPAESVALRQMIQVQLRSSRFASATETDLRGAA